MEEDAEIRALKVQLATVQLQDTVHRLSERNCVEILLKLVETGRVDLIFTANRKECLTPQRLRDEIEDELVVHNGRVAVVELPAVLGVDVSSIEPAVASLLEGSRRLQLVSGQLITDYYLDSVLQEANELLQQAGQLSVASLAQRFVLPADLLLSATRARLNTIVFGRLDQGILYTPSFVSRHLARVRGVFAGLARPTTVRSLVVAHELMAELAFKQLQELVQAGWLAGTLKGAQGRASFVPHFYTRSQEETFRQFYAQNGYVEYTTLSKMDIARPRQYLQKVFPDGSALDSVFVSPTYKDALCGLLENTIEQQCWADAAELLLELPATEEDAETLLALCLKVVTASRRKQAKDRTDGPQLVALADVFAASSHFLSFCLQQLEPVVRVHAAEALRKQRAAGEAKEKEVPEEEEEEGRRKKGRRRAKKPSRRARKGREKTASSAVAFTLTNLELKAELVKALAVREAEGGPQVPPDELAVAIVAHLRPTLQQLFLKAVQAVQTSGASDRRARHEDIGQALSHVLQHVQLFHKAVDALLTGRETENESGREALALSLQVHLLKTLGLNALDLLLSHELMFHNLTPPVPSPQPAPQTELASLTRSVSTISTASDVDLTKRARAGGGEPVPSLAAGMPEFTWTERQAILAQLPEESRVSLDNLVAVLQARVKSSSELVRAIQATADVCGLRLVSLDRKKERAFQFSLRCAMAARLEEALHPVVALQYTVLLLYAQAFGRVVHAPRRAVPAVLVVLQPLLVPAVFKKLKRWVDMSHEFLQAYRTEALEKKESGSVEEEEEEEEEEKESVVLLRRLAEDLEAIKRTGKDPKAAFAEQS